MTTGAGDGRRAERKKADPHLVERRKKRYSKTMGPSAVLLPGRWLTGEDFARVKAEHIQEAVRALLSGSVVHPFAKSTDYDVVLDDGMRLAPKAVFGIAARRALGIEVRPRDFRGGEGTPCFRTIRAAQFRIVPKQRGGGVPPDPGDAWVEGDPKRMTHVRYERNTRAARSKKRAFKEEHGQLICEECGLVPVDQYGDESGDACIEVHHIIPLASLRTRRNTRHEDLMCVCANCHRVLHHRMRQEVGKERRKAE